MYTNKHTHTLHTWGCTRKELSVGVIRPPDLLARVQGYTILVHRSAHPNNAHFYFLFFCFALHMPTLHVRLSARVDAPCRHIALHVLARARATCIYVQEEDGMSLRTQGRAW